MKTFRIKIPAQNKKKSEAFAQLLHNLHETLRDSSVSFEIVTEHQHVAFAFACEDSDVPLISGQIYSIYPDAEIAEVEDPLGKIDAWAGATISLERPDIYPIKTHPEFEGDSLSGLLSVLSKTGLKEKIIVQFILKPRNDSGGLHFKRNWRKRFDGIRHKFRMKYWFKEGNIKGKFKEAFEKKESGHLYDTAIRYLVSAADQGTAEGICKSIAGAFQQFNTVDLNKLLTEDTKSKSHLKVMRDRKLTNALLFSEEEIATIYHLPNEREVPNLVYVLSKKSEPPQSLPTEKEDTEISFFGQTNFHNTNVEFGIRRNDRRRHLYTVGKSGSGKSKLLELLIKNDLESGNGVGVLDPHGDLIDNILRMIPKKRVKDVVIFDPSDEAYPIAFNPLEKVPNPLKMRVTIGFLEIFKKLFGSNWSDRLEHVLRYTILALLDSPNTTVLSIQKMLTDKTYRQSIVKNIQDDVVKSFWVNEFAGWSQKFDSEAITPLLNKIGQFIATNMIRNIVGQPENKINFREIMDGKKILLMKISKGLLGEENSQLLGAFAITKIYQAAMSRADILEEERQDFYLYVDEFQNFTTDTFGEILSEARKYRLALTLAHQFLGQLSPALQKTVFGNVGSLISFRVGADDANILSEEFAPVFSKHDIINLGVREFYTKMAISGETTQAFSGRTLDVNIPKQNFAKECIEHSRQTYCSPLKDVEKLINDWNEGREPEASKQKGGGDEEAGFEAPLI